MKVKIKGGASTTLSQSHFVAEGGEGKVYIAKEIAYKIGNTIPASKISEFQLLKSNSAICIPQHELLDSKDNICGYTMRAVKSICTFEELFTEQSKIDLGVDRDNLLRISTELFDILRFIHPKGFLVVDANSLNFLLNQSKKVVAIDVNSWKTPSHNPTAIMPIIRDFAAGNKVSELTDFYSAGCLVFNAWANIHPYKGNHPNFKHFKRSQIIEKIEARCKAHISVFNKDSTYPNCVNLDCLPQGLAAWCFDIFEKGLRKEPPKNLEKPAQIERPLQKKVVKVSGLDIKKYKIYEPFSHISLIKGQIIIGGKKQETNLSHLHKSDNHYYGVANNKYCQLELFQNTKVLINPLTNFLDMPMATKPFNGGIYQNIVGNAFFYVGGQQVQLDHMKGKKVLDAQYKKGILCIAYSHGAKKYLSFINTKTKKEIYLYDDIQLQKPNFSVLDNGIIIAKIEDQLHIFSERSSSVKVVDTDLPSNAYLLEEDNKFCFWVGDDSFHGTLK